MSGLEPFKDDGGVAAPFNMAINTLERLGEILREIKQVSFFRSGESQKVKVSLVREFFIQAVPLLPTKVVEDFQERFLDLQPKEVDVVNQYNGKPIRRQAFYSLELDKTMDTLLIKIQQELQKEKFFMPPKKDPRNAVSDF